MSYFTYTYEEFVEAVKTSISKREVLKKLGLTPHGGNYRTFNNFVKKHNIDTSHFKGTGWSKNLKFGRKFPTEVYLNNERPISSYKLKNRLLVENFFEYKCTMCQGTEWLGNPIPLELDHIDGNHENNNLSNLRLLCPNCHALTPTYRGKTLNNFN